MYRILLLGTVLLLAAHLVDAQTAPECPTIDIIGPAGIVEPGEPVTFTAILSEKRGTSRLDYVWSISSGKISSGQGSPTIVIHPDRSVTVTVEIRGLPPGCPAEASGFYGGHSPPTAEKIHELKEGQTIGDDALEMLVSTARNHPHDQVFVLVGQVPGQNDQPIRLIEIGIRGSLIRHGIHLDRLTVARVPSKIQFVEIWRVPPSADNPRCLECEKWQASIKDCPTIMVTGPAGVHMPHDAMTFVVDVTGHETEKLGFHWEVTGGEIMGGQNTRELKARYISISQFMATVKVSGLPSGCPMKVSEGLNMSEPHEPEHLGAINNPRYTIDNKLLTKIGAELHANQTSQLFVWVYFGPNERNFEKIRSYLLRQLTVTKIDPARFTIEGSPLSQVGATFWRIPPGADNPAP